MRKASEVAQREWRGNGGGGGGGGNITGGGAIPQVTYWTGAVSIGGDNNFLWYKVAKDFQVGDLAGNGVKTLLSNTNDTIFNGDVSGGIYFAGSASAGLAGVTGLGIDLLNNTYTLGDGAHSLKSTRITINDSIQIVADETDYNGTNNAITFYSQYLSDGSIGATAIGDVSFALNSTIFHVNDVTQGFSMATTYNGSPSINFTSMYLTDGSSGITMIGDISGVLNSTVFTVNDTLMKYIFSTPNLKIGALDYVFPAAYGSAGDVLTDTTGAGNLAWSPAGGGGTPSLTFKEIAWGDATNHMTSSSNLTWDNVNFIFTISDIAILNQQTGSYQIGNLGGAGNGCRIILDDSAQEFEVALSGQALVLAPTTGTGFYSMGDVYHSFAGNGINFTMNDSASTAKIATAAGRMLNVDQSNQLYSLGDIDGVGNGTSLLVDDSGSGIAFNFGITSYTFPNTNADGYLKNDGTGVLTWAAGGGGGVTSFNTLTGDVTISEGAGIVFNTVGNNIEIDVTIPQYQIPFGDGSNLMTSSSYLEWDGSKMIMNGGGGGGAFCTYINAGNGNGSATYNIGIGVTSPSTLQNITNGQYNIVIGQGAGTVITSGSGNVLIGYGADMAPFSGTISNSIALGQTATITTNNQFVVGGGMFNIPNWHINGLDYVMPSAYGGTGYVLTNTDGAGTLAWDAIPTPPLAQYQIAFGDSMNLMTSSDNLLYEGNDFIVNYTLATTQFFVAPSSSTIQGIAGIVNDLQFTFNDTDDKFYLSDSVASVASGIFFAGANSTGLVGNIVGLGLDVLNATYYLGQYTGNGSALTINDIANTITLTDNVSNGSGIFYKGANAVGLSAYTLTQKITDAATFNSSLYINKVSANLSFENVGNGNQTGISLTDQSILLGMLAGTNNGTNILLNDTANTITITDNVSSAGIYFAGVNSAGLTNPIGVGVDLFNNAYTVGDTTGSNYLFINSLGASLGNISQSVNGTVVVVSDGGNFVSITDNVSGTFGQTGIFYAGANSAGLGFLPQGLGIDIVNDAYFLGNVLTSYLFLNKPSDGTSDLTIASNLTISAGREITMTSLGDMNINVGGSLYVNTNLTYTGTLAGAAGKSVVNGLIIN